MVACQALSCRRTAMIGLGLFLPLIWGTLVLLAQDDETTFVKLDVNEGGELSAKVAKSVLRFDANSDGEVSTDEYLAGIAQERRHLSPC